MDLYIVRHGNTKWNTLNLIQGSRDIPLDKKGISESKILMEKLNKFDIDLIISSPLKRAIQTATIIGNNRNIPIEIVEDLIEVDFGVWQGLTWKKILYHYKEYIATNTYHGYANPPEGETYDEVDIRICRFANNVFSFCEENIVIVTHRAIIRFLLSYILKKNLAEINTFKLPNTSIIKIKIQKREAIYYKYL
ncbi:MAG: histidine phosphatase family protein [Eubacteriaceae bacterium]